MNVSSAITGFLSHIKETTLVDFEMIGLEFIFDENLDFRGRTSQFVARRNEYQKTEGNQPTDWAYIIWNRGSLASSDVLNRPLRVGTSNTANELTGVSDIRYASLDVELKIVTNNTEIAETIEEYLHVTTGERVTFIADYGTPFGDFACSASGESSTTFEREELTEVGSVTAIGLSSVIHFPIILPSEAVKRIEHIHNKIYDNFQPEENLVSDDWVVSQP